MQDSRFALVGALLVGTVAAFGPGCSSSSKTSTAAAGGDGTNVPTADGGGDTTLPTPGNGKDAGPVGPMDCEPDFVAQKSNPPATPQDACSDADVAALEKDCVKGSDRWEGASCTAHKSEKCYTCVVTPLAAAKWGPMIEEGGDTGFRDGFTINRAGCIDIVGGTPGCGDALVADSDCSFYECSEEQCSDPTKLAACTDKAQAACKALPPVSAACLAAWKKASACGKGDDNLPKFRAAVKAFCQAK
jgi:hypothetical protein